MTPTLILTIILTLATVRPLVELPQTRAKREALQRGGYRLDATTGCLYVLLENAGTKARA